MRTSQRTLLLVALAAPTTLGYGRSLGPWLRAPTRRVPNRLPQPSQCRADRPPVPPALPSPCAVERGRVVCSGGPPEAPGGYTLYQQRWVQLAYLSLLALISDWVCFSVAATPETWKQAYGHDPATLIDIFLFTNVLFCFLEPAIVRRFGLRQVIVAAAFAMTAGCTLRSGLPLTGSMPPYAFEVAGTVLVGASQPMFQCTPPLLSATWFGSDERALATAIAINFNQVGIATAFLVGGIMASSTAGLSQYFDLITFGAAAVAVGALLQFQERPLTPPSGSAAARLNAPPEEESFVVTAKQLLATPGFLPPLVAFVVSIGVSNVFSAFVEETMLAAGFTSQNTIDLTGAGFQAAIVLGGILLGGYVDRTKQYKAVTLGCFVASLAMLAPLGLDGSPKVVVLCCILALGAFIGPVQPINAELAVEVAYPADENSIEALQQLCGNLFSALLVPVAERAEEVHISVPGTTATVSGDILLLFGLASFGLAYFSTFTGTLKRSAIDCDLDASVSGCELVEEVVDDISKGSAAPLPTAASESPPP